MSGFDWSHCKPFHDVICGCQHCQMHLCSLALKLLPSVNNLVLISLFEIQIKFLGLLSFSCSARIPVLSLLYLWWLALVWELYYDKILLNFDPFLVWTRDYVDIFHGVSYRPSFQMSLSIMVRFFKALSSSIVSIWMQMIFCLFLVMYFFFFLNELF